MLSSFVLKIIAIISMTCDHVSNTIFNKFTFLNLIGRLAFPIFAFQISEGYVHTKNLKKYIFRLFIFALIAQVPFMLFLSTFTKDIWCLNVFFTLLLGLIAILIYDKIPNKFLSLSICTIIAICAELLKTDYGFFGVFIILIFYMFKDKKVLLTVIYILSCFIKYLPYLIKYNFYYAYIQVIIATSLSIIFILLYNGKQGKKTKYFLYIFYPLHMLILYFIHVFILNI